MSLVTTNNTCRKTHNNSNPVQIGLNIVVWSEAENFTGWYEAVEQADNETDCQTLGDFGLALRPASDWLISFWLSADRDRSNRVCIDHLTTVIRLDANGQVVANDKDLNMKFRFYGSLLFLSVHSPICSFSLHHLRFLFSSLFSFFHCEYLYSRPLAFHWLTHFH